MATLRISDKSAREIDWKRAEVEVVCDHAQRARKSVLKKSWPLERAAKSFDGAKKEVCTTIRATQEEECKKGELQRQRERKGNTKSIQRLPISRKVKTESVFWFLNKAKKGNFCFCLGRNSKSGWFQF